MSSGAGTVTPPTARTPLGALPHLSPSARRALWISGALAVAQGLALVVQAWALASALAAVVTEGFGPERLTGRLALLAGAIAVRAVLSWATESVSARAAAGAKEELRSLLIDSALRRGPEWIHRRGSAELTTLATKGLDSLDAYFTRYLPALVNAAVVPPIVGAWILWSDVTSALIVLITVPLIPLFAWLVGRYTENHTAGAADALQRLSGHLLELLRAMPVLSAFGRARAQGDAVARVSEQHRRKAVATLRIAFLSALVLELCSSLSVALLAVGIGLRLVAGDMELVTGLMVLILAPECYLPLRNAGAAHHASEDGLEAVRRVDEIVSDNTAGSDTATGRQDDSETRTLPASGAATRHLPEGAVALRVRQLRVARRGGHAPDGLSFTAQPGEITHLDGFGGIGPSGSGKSSTFAALLGFVPAEGSVTCGDVDIAEADLAEWRRTVAWAPQRPVFSGGTVRDELKLAASDQPEGSTRWIPEVLSSAAAAHLADRPVDALSTGERQRVAVARALIRLRGHARLLLLDEPTAHLDQDTAGRINAAVRAAAENGATVVLASHRPGEEGPAQPDSPETEDEPAEPLPPARGKLRELIGPRGMGGVALGALSLLSGTALTALAAWLIARASQQPPVLTLSVAVVGVRTFALSRAVLRYLERLLTHDAAFRLAGDLRRRLWEGLVRIGPVRTAALRRGDGLSRLVDDADTVRDLVPRVIVPPLVACCTAAGAVAIELAVLPSAGLLLAAALVVAAPAGPAVALAVERHASTAVAEGRRSVAARVLGLLDASAELLAFGAARHRRAELANADTALAARARRAATGAGAANAVNTLFIGVAVLGCTWLAAEAVAAGRLAPELAPILALVSLAAAEAVAELPTAAQQWRALRAAQSRITPLLHAGEPEQRPAAAPAGNEDGAVELDGVDVRWPSAAGLALRQATLHLPRGTHVAVVGPSGGGKSTLLALLLGFLEPENGRVAAPRELTWCPQEPQLVSTTIRENLKLAAPRADDARLGEALDTAGLPGWVDRLDEVLGTGGVAVSGGEAARLALARAVLVEEAELVLLDEPTAHLDVATARQVLAGLRDWSRGRTVVHVTHRFSETEDADLVLRVSGGEITVLRRGDPAGNGERVVDDRVPAR